MSQLTEQELAHFMSYVEKLPSGCWFWNGARSRGRGKKWYGSYWWRGQSIRAHRFAHDHIKGGLCPPGYHRDHVCRFSLCVNPDHLEAVTNEINLFRRSDRCIHSLVRMAEAW